MAKANEKHARKRNLLIAAAAFALALAAAGVIARNRYGVDLSLSAENLRHLREWFRALASEHPAGSAALFFVFVFAAAAAGLSRLALCALSGVLFGKWTGIALALPATVLGSWVVYLAGRVAGIERIQKLLGAKTRHIAELPGEIGWLDVVVARQLPLPAPVVNLLLAAAATRSAPFLLGTSTGYLPGTLIAVFLGHGAITAAAADRPGFTAAIAAAIITATLALLLRGFVKVRKLRK